MTSRHGFHGWTTQIVLKGLNILNNKMQERKTFFIKNTAVDHKLVTEEIDGDLASEVRLYEYLKPSPALIELPDVSYDYVRSGLLFYREELNKARKIAGLSESLKKEIEEVERILNLESIKNASNKAYDKYSSIVIEQEDESDKINDMVDKLIDLIEEFNVLSREKLGCTVFKSSAKLLKDLKHQVENEPEFVFRIALIATLIDEVYHDEILKQIMKKPESGSINLIEELFVEKKVQKYESAVTKLRRLHRLRSTKQPIHDKEHEAVAILKELGVSYPINWKEAGNVCMDTFLQSVEEMVESLRNYK